MSEQIVEKDVLLQAQGFWSKYQKPLLIGLTAGLLIGAGWFGYKKYFSEPKEVKAAEAMYIIDKAFGMDSSNLVLNGDGVNKGALYIIKTYDGTKAANLAKYYAGVSYLKLKDYNNAIKYLKEFSTDAKQVQLNAYAALAHAYAETGKKEEAVEYYKKAGHTFTEDELNSSENLFLAASLLETMKKEKEALEIYKEIKEKYPMTEKGFQAEKYINRLSVEKNDFSIN
jgi:tetratricopeptide (TPR) repeat protein